MTNAELRELTQDKLTAELEAAHREMFNLRMQRAGGQMTKNHLFKEIRSKIARILTILNEKAKS